MKIIQTLPTYSLQDIYQSSQKDNKNYVSEICISHDGNYVYVSNRGYDCIACFEVDYQTQGQLNFISCISTYGKCPRHFNITPDDLYLICANQDSNNLVIYQRNINNGLLKYLNEIKGGKGNDIEFSAPNFIIFYPVSIQELLNLQESEDDSDSYNTTNISETNSFVSSSDNNN